VKVIDAALTAQAIAQGERTATTIPPGYIILALKIGVLGLSCLYIGLVWSLISFGLAMFGLSEASQP